MGNFRGGFSFLNKKRIKNNVTTKHIRTITITGASECVELLTNGKLKPIDRRPDKGRVDYQKAKWSFTSGTGIGDS